MEIFIENECNLISKYDFFLILKKKGFFFKVGLLDKMLWIVLELEVVFLFC